MAQLWACRAGVGTISGWERESERQHSWCFMARGMEELELCLILGCRGEQVVGVSVMVKSSAMLVRYGIINL